MIYKVNWYDFGPVWCNFDGIDFHQNKLLAKDVVFRKQPSEY